MRVQHGCVAALVFIGCGAATPKAAVHAPPTSAPPTVIWTPSVEGESFASGEFTWSGLPAVAADGSAVMVAVHEQSGGPDMPNLTLIEKGRDDAEVGKLVVMDATEGQDQAAKPKDLPGANKWLRDRHQARDWRPLTDAFDRPEATDDGVPDTASKGAIVVHWQEGHLTVTDGGKTVVDAKHPDWLVKPYKVVPDAEDMCENPSRLDGVLGDAAHHLLLVTIAYHGTDSCWEPAPTAHVVAW
jgi:hypothetical protein